MSILCTQELLISINLITKEDAVSFSAAVFMKKKKEFDQSAIYLICSFISWCFLGNLYFIICNIPIILVLIGIRGVISPGTLIMLFFAALFTAPAYTALLGTMGKAIKDNSLSFTKTYFKSYKQNFKQSFIIGALISFITFISFIDTKFFAAQSYGSYFIPVLYALLIFIYLIALNAFPIISRFYMRNRDILKISFYYTFKKIKITIINIIIFIIALLFFNRFVSIGILFVFGAVSLLVMFNEKEILEELEESIKQQQQDK